MSASKIEDLIDSVKDEKQPKYLRRMWLITVKSKLMELTKEVASLEKKYSELLKEKK